MNTRLLLLALLWLPIPALAQLQIQDAYFEDYDRRLVRDQKLPAGEALYLTFRIGGFKQDDQRNVRLSWFVDCLDPQGRPLAETTAEKIVQTLAPQDESWRPKVDWSLVIPNYAESGQYQVLIRVRDEMANTNAEKKMTFQVTGLSFEPSTSLAVRGFEFMDSEEGRSKISPVFSSGAMMWARFRVLGYKISPDKQVGVEVDLSILDLEGKVLYSRPQAAVEKHRMFYPPRFLTEIFSLQMPKAPKPFEYVLRLELRDLIGNQEAQYETKFTVQP